MTSIVQLISVGPMSLPVSPQPSSAGSPGFSSKKGVLALSGTPEEASIPVIFASPHSGRNYDEALLERTPVAMHQLRRSEDAFVDMLVEPAAESGGLLLNALFPRVFIDVNRSARELDPAMFCERLPQDAYEESRRTASGLGVLPRVTADGMPIYRRKFRLDEARERLDTYYTPYHQTLSAAVAALKARFGIAIILDMHSMPKLSARGADIVLGDRFGTSCAPALTAFAERSFSADGLVAVRNTPYAGGYTTEHYGRPEEGVHALQIEINRGLYMDEQRVAIASGFNLMREKISSFINAVAKADWSRTLSS